MKMEQLLSSSAANWRAPNRASANIKAVEDDIRGMDNAGVLMMTDCITSYLAESEASTHRWACDCALVYLWGEIYRRIDEGL